MLCRVIASLVLVHGMFAAPLLVVCINADGRVLIEIVGHDPCHEPREGIHTTAAAAPHMEAWHDPCLDLLLNKPASVQAQDSLPLPSSSAYQVAEVLDPSIHPQALRRNWPFAWHPLIFPIDARSPDIPIRI